MYIEMKDIYEVWEYYDNGEAYEEHDYKNKLIRIYESLPDAVEFTKGYMNKRIKDAIKYMNEECLYGNRYGKIIVHPLKARELDHYNLGDTLYIGKCSLKDINICGDSYCKFYITKSVLY